MVFFPEDCDKTATEFIHEFVSSLSEETASGFITVYNNVDDAYNVGVYNKAGNPIFRCNGIFGGLWTSPLDKVRYIIREDHISLDVYVKQQAYPPTIEGRLDALTHRIDKLESEVKNADFTRQVNELKTRLGKEE